MERRRSHLLQDAGALAIALICGVSVLLTARSAAAQRIVVPAPGQATGDAAAEEVAENPFPTADRAIVQQLTRGLEWLKQGRYSEALDCWDQILQAPDDYFYQPDKKVPRHGGLRDEARRLIGQLPREGRDLYELKRGHDARKLLDKALAAGDEAKLAEASGRFFHTRAGYEATFLLGLFYLDRGEPLAGAWQFERLREADAGGDRFEPALTLAMAAAWLEAGDTERARQTLLLLKARRADAALTIGGRQIAWFDKDADALPWLARLVGPQLTVAAREADRWLMYRGDVARNAASVGGTPLLSLCWRIPTIGDRQAEDTLGQLRQMYQEQHGTAVLSGLHPLAVNDMVLMRTLQNLVAIDFKTGKRLWDVPADDPLDVINRSNGEPYRQMMPWATLLAQRLWEDSTYGTLSSDGRLVFSIEDLSLTPANNVYGNGMGGVVVFGGPFRGNVPVNHGPYNRLAAHDITTGKLKWALGGAAGQFALPLAETFFLGPPLPLQGQLFVIGETSDEIRLFVLEADSGKLVWSQQLSAVDHNLFPDSWLRMAGLSPSYAEGIIVCPTGAGAVVAVDLATRSLRWGYRYSHDKNNNQYRQQMLMRFGGYAGAAPAQRWFDGTATIVDRKVLLTPAESDSLYCLNLTDGKPLWDPLPRRNDLYVACVHAGQVVLVGRGEMHAIQLADGKPGWDKRTVRFPEESAPSGRGFFSGHCYYVPLNSAEVVAVDLDRVKIVQTSKSRDGAIPGNLVCYRGKMLSQGWDGLDVFYQVDALRDEVGRQLAAHPDDAKALALQAEILLDEGNRDAAIVNLRRAYQLTPDERTREVFRAALLDGLRADFAAYRGRAAEIEGLLDEPVQRAAYLRLMANGLQQAGQWRAAFDQYMRLMELDCHDRRMEMVDRTLLVRRDRWIQAGLAALRHEAQGQVAAEIDKVVEERLNAARADTSPQALQHFLDYFAGPPAAARARHELIQRLIADHHSLEAELLLWRDQQSPDSAVAGPAVAELARLLEQAKRFEGAATCYRQLRTQFADVVCRDGKTGKQLAEALPPAGPIARLFKAEPAWPTGEVETKKSFINNAREGFGRFLVEYQGDPGPFYSGMTLRFDQTRTALLGYDGYGIKRVEVPLSDGGQRNIIGYNPNMTNAYALGHLLVLPISSTILGLDPAGLASGGGKPAQLWGQDLTDSGADTTKNVLARVAGAAPVLGAPAFGFVQFSFRLNPVGAVTSRYVCFQRFRNLVVIDPIRGEPLWVRRDLPLTRSDNLPVGSEVFGDDDFIFVVPSETASPAAAANDGASGDAKPLPPAEALVFRAQDGQSLGKRNVPRVRYRGEGGMANNVAFGINPFGVATVEEAADACLATLGRNILAWRIDSKTNKAMLDLFDPWQQRAVWATRTFNAAAKTSLVAHEALGVMEPDGHFVLVDLANGRSLADLKLAADENLADILVVRSGSQYLLLTHSDKPRKDNANTNTQQLPGTQSYAIPQGQVYSFDRQGKLLWLDPVTIEDQQFLLGQPERLPVVVFACQQYGQRANGQQWMKTSVLCLDKRSGRVLYRGDTPRTTGCLDIVGDPEKKTVELRMQMDTVTLTFTDKPLPAAAKPAAGTATPKRSKLSDALWKALDKSFHGGGP